MTGSEDRWIKSHTNCIFLPLFAGIGCRIIMTISHWSLTNIQIKSNQISCWHGERNVHKHREAGFVLSFSLMMLGFSSARETVFALLFVNYIPTPLLCLPTRTHNNTHVWVERVRTWWVLRGILGNVCRGGRLRRSRFNETLDLM